MAKRKKKHGFTFVETILAIVIVGAIASVAAKVLTSGLDVYSLVVNRHDASHRARLSMERMVDEIVLINSGDILGMSNTRLRFRDSDGISTDFKQQTVTYQGRSTPCLYRGDDFLAENVGSFDFDYYTSTGSSTIWAAQVRRINIELTIEAMADAGSIHLRTDVFPRNFMYSNFE